MVLSSFEHDFVEEESARDSSSKLLVGQPTGTEQGNTVWNAKVGLTYKFINFTFLFILYDKMHLIALNCLLDFIIFVPYIIFFSSV